MVCTKPIFGLEGWEVQNQEKRKKSKTPSKLSIERGIRRARQQIKDYALCNDFKYFVTLTLDQQKIDRYDMGEIIKKLNVWLDNRVRRNGLKYVLVPERHKDGAIHFHGFFNDALPVEKAKVSKTPHKIFNLPNWTYGFSTAIELYGEYEKAVSYVCKYVGKSFEKIGGRWYYCGGDLLTPKVEYIDVEDDCWRSEDGVKFDISEAKLSFISFNGVCENLGELLPPSSSGNIEKST